MNNKIAVLGVNDNAICFDFDKKIVYFFRKGWASRNLKLVDIAIPFNKITAIEFIKPETWQTGRIALIVEGNRLLAEDERFDNNASELSVGESMYPTLQEAVTKLAKEYPDIQLVTAGQLDVPKTKNQKKYATSVTYEAFSNSSGAPVTTVKTTGMSLGVALGMLAVAIICIIISICVIFGSFM